MPIEFFQGRQLSQDELDLIRLQIEEMDSIDVIDDEIRAIVMRNWPHLIPKLPPE